MKDRAIKKARGENYRRESERSQNSLGIVGIKLVRLDHRDGIYNVELEILAKTTVFKELCEGLLLEVLKRLIVLFCRLSQDGQELGELSFLFEGDRFVLEDVALGGRDLRHFCE